MHPHFHINGNHPIWTSYIRLPHIATEIIAVFGPCKPNIGAT